MRLLPRHKEQQSKFAGQCLHSSCTVHKCAHPKTPEEIQRGGYLDGPFANDLLYEEFLRYHRWLKITPKHWERRKAEENLIARLDSVNAGNAELTALRILLQNNRGFNNYFSRSSHMIDELFRPYLLE